MRRNVIPAGAEDAVVIGTDPELPISIEYTAGCDYPYSQTMEMLSLAAARAVGRALLEAVEALDGGGTVGRELAGEEGQSWTP